MHPQTEQMVTMHTIRVKIEDKNIEIIDDVVEVKGGHLVKWVNIQDNEPFCIIFKYNNNKNQNANGKESPFWVEELSYDGATAFQRVSWGGKFKYTLILDSDHNRRVDPVVDVDPPTYPY